MPRGVSSTRVRAEVEAALTRDDAHLRTVVPLWTLNRRVRMRVADEFVGRRVEVDVWPTREDGQEDNRTHQFCRVLSAAYNPDWGHQGTAVLVLEFEEGLGKQDLPIPMSMVAEIRTVDIGYVDGATLTADDVRDLRLGHTINALRPDGTEVVVTPDRLND